MQALLEHAAGIDELPAMPDRSQQRFDRRRRARAAGALAQQPDQRRAIAIVGLEPPRPQLRPSRLRLRRREHSERPRPAPLDLSRPRPMQCPGRLDPDHRFAVDAAAGDQPRQLLDTVAQQPSNDTGSPINPRSPVVSHTLLLTFPGSIATISRSPEISLSSKSEDISPSR
jgi:hypothetical protein